MKIVTEGATCELCAKPGKSACRKCINRNGRPGFVPRPDVTVREVWGYTFDRRGRPVETVFKKVENPAS